MSAQRIPEIILDDVNELSVLLKEKSDLQNELRELLTAEEVQALAARIKNLLKDPIFPYPSENVRPFPYPLV